jgi:hypothetical protein
MVVRRFRRLALIVLFMVLGKAVPVYSQTYDVVGLVQDEEKGEPIGFVEISLASGKVLGFTRSNGRFEINVNSRSSVLIFKRNTYKTTELDLSDLTELIDIEVSMQNDVFELSDVDTTARSQSRQLTQAKTMDELELMQGMKIDLNDHLRQLPGVSGMNEFTSDISVWGSRTNDVTHYLGQARIPSLRHLDIGFPGNQSVLNPRLLKSITVADNLAKGPINQGNASALVYDLKDGDPNNITGDIVFGTVNRELNMTGYWGGRTFIMSGRYLEPTFLANLGTKFFTEPKDARLKNQGKPCDTTVTCREIKEPFAFKTMDGYIGTFYRDSTGAYARHSILGLDDTYEVNQDVSRTLEESVPQTIVKGTQDGWVYAYESLTPYATGDLQYSLGFLKRNREEVFRDTLETVSRSEFYEPWYYPSGQTVDHLIGDGSAQDLQLNTSFQWNPNGKMWGATYSYGLDLELPQEIRKFLNISPNLPEKRVPQDYLLANGLLRLKWGLAGKPNLELATGSSLVYQGIIEGENPGPKLPAPVISIRYSRPLPGKLSGYGEVAIRQNTALAPVGFNRLDAITTSSAESKLGVEGGWKDDVKFTSNLYTRFYQDPRLPAPEVFWNYAETHVSDYAYVNGGNITAAWLPSHHLGMNMNGSIVQGDYHLEDGSFLPWEANRTLDLVSNIRIVPRNDSLLSFILTYGVNNGAPLYEYTGMYIPDKLISTNERTVRPSRSFPTVSRQRTDVRINLDLKSHWRPLEGMRFFFEADNIFADANSAAFSWLGGDNRRRRGWTRANPYGDLRPVVTRGMGLFIMFGFEGRLLI